MMPDSGTRNILVREEMLERNTLCVASANPGFTLHRGDEGFLESLKRHYTPHENNAAEKLVLLKSRLASLSTDKFWTELMEGITDILGSQYVFVVKRILTEEQQGSVVEMPAIGEPGSCLMAIAFYYDDGHSLQEHVRDYKYLALGDPCAQMKHDKVFLVPSYLSDYIKERANEFQIDVQSYIGIPLSSKGKCFAHFGALWSLPGLEKRNLSWGFVEMTLHALEDLIIERLLEGKRFSNAKSDRRVMPVPKAAVTAVQSLRPYARSLSHELRTPMQGVVGMLDLMYALVQEALESPPNEDVASVFRTLRENIEVVQGSFWI